jgi:hypothetical protein
MRRLLDVARHGRNVCGTLLGLGAAAGCDAALLLRPHGQRRHALNITMVMVMVATPVTDATASSAGRQSPGLSLSFSPWMPCLDCWAGRDRAVTHLACAGATLTRSQSSQRPWIKITPWSVPTLAPPMDDGAWPGSGRLTTRAAPATGDTLTWTASRGR